MLTGCATVSNFNPEWISAACNVLLLILTAVSVYYAFRAYKHQKERSKKEAACNLAKYYAENIINKYSDVSNIFSAAGITETVRSVFELRDLKEFDKAELEALLKKSNMTVDDFKKKLDSIDPKIILNTRMKTAGSIEERGRTYDSFATVDENGEIKVINEAFLKGDFQKEICALLNELEWFTMNCKYGLADEKLIYQSLHQTFIATVWMLYFYISNMNINNEDKFYTNIVWLFLQWRNRLISITDKKEAEKQAYINKANSVTAKVYESDILK